MCMLDPSSLYKCTHASTAVATTNNKCILRSLQGTAVEPKETSKVSGPKNKSKVIKEDAASASPSKRRHSKHGTVMKLRSVDANSEFEDATAEIVPIKNDSMQVISESEEDVKKAKANSSKSQSESSESAGDAKDTRADAQNEGWSNG